MRLRRTLTVDFRKSIDDCPPIVELDVKVAVFDPVLFVFFNKPRNRVKLLYLERNDFCLWPVPAHVIDNGTPQASLRT